MTRPLLSLERLSLNEMQAKVCCPYGKKAKDVDRMGYLEIIARVTSHETPSEYYSCSSLDPARQVRLISGAF